MGTTVFLPPMFLLPLSLTTLPAMLLCPLLAPTLLLPPLLPAMEHMLLLLPTMDGLTLPMLESAPTFMDSRFLAKQMKQEDMIQRNEIIIKRNQLQTFCSAFKLNIPSKI